MSGSITAAKTANGETTSSVKVRKTELNRTTAHEGLEAGVGIEPASTALQAAA
ncbi:MAG: hypothetical protein RI937_366 [Pseudomonadota bacterium]